MNWATRRRPAAKRPSDYQAEILQLAANQQRRERSVPRVPEPSPAGATEVLAGVLLFIAIIWTAARWLG